MASAPALWLSLKSEVCLPDFCVPGPFGDAQSGQGASAPCCLCPVLG